MKLFQSVLKELGNKKDKFSQKCKQPHYSLGYCFHLVCFADCGRFGQRLSRAEYGHEKKLLSR